MTDQTTTNGQRHDLDQRLPFVPFDPTAGKDTTDAITPVLDDEGGITAGNETGREETLSPVEGHEVVVKPEKGRRWEALREQDLEVPAALRDPAAFKTAARREGRALRNACLIGLAQGPRMAFRFAWWAVRGLAITTSSLSMWLIVRELHPDLSNTPATSDKAAIAMDHRRAMRQRIRRNIALTGIVLIVGMGAAAWWYLGAWPLWLAAGAFMAGMTWRGKPKGRKVFMPTGGQQLRPRLTLESIVAAFGVLGIAGINESIKAGTTDRWWTSTPQAIKGGHVVDMVLPHGVEARSVIQHEQRLAGALGRAEDCVIIEPRPRMTPSNLRLWVFDSPQLEKAGAGPLVTAKRTSWFEPVQIGVTRSGHPHKELLRGGSWFIGGRPGAGKSSTGFAACSHAALDPTCRLMISNLKGSADYVPFERVAERVIVGSPETNRDVIPDTIALIEWVLAEAGRRNDFLNDLRRKGVPGCNDVTPELVKKYPKILGPLVVLIDEIHRLFDESDNPDAKETAETLAKAIKAVRSAGITIIMITQLGGTESIPAVIPRAARLRGCMRVGDEVSYRQIFGNSGGKGAFGRSGVGALRPGQIILASDSGDPVKVGVHYLEPHLDRICERAHTLRTALGVLAGHAAGDDAPLPQKIDPAALLRDILTAIPTTAPTGGPADADVAWVTELEVALSENPDYRGRGAGWLSSELRNRRVPTVQTNRRTPVSDGYPSGQRNETGVRTGDVRTALERLVTE